MKYNNKKRVYKSKSEKEQNVTGLNMSRVMRCMFKILVVVQVYYLHDQSICKCCHIRLSDLLNPDPRVHILFNFQVLAKDNT